MNESQLQLGIDRITKKLYRTKTEKEKLDDLAQQLVEINREKKLLRNEFYSNQQTSDINIGVEMTVLREIFDDLRISNELKKDHLKRSTLLSETRHFVRIEVATEVHDSLSTQQISNDQTLAAVERLAEIEEGSHEGLQFIIERLDSDVKILRKKIDQKAWYKNLHDKNLSKISNSQTQVRFKKVFAIGLLQNQAISVDSMLKQHYEVVRSRQQIMERQKEEIINLESECALTAIKINDTTQLIHGLNIQLRRMERNESMGTAEGAKRSFREQMERYLRNMVEFLASKSSILIKRQFVICISDLLKNSNLNSQDSESLNKARKLLMMGETDNDCEFNIIDNLNNDFLLQEKSKNPNGRKFIVYSGAIDKAKEVIFQIPCHLQVVLLVNFFIRLRESSESKNFRFSDLHEQWIQNSRILKDIENQYFFLNNRMMPQRKTAVEVGNELADSELEKNLQKVSQMLEVIFRVRVFISNFSLRIQSLLHKVNQVCSDVQFKFQFNVFCPFNLPITESSEYHESGNMPHTLENTSGLSVDHSTLRADLIEDVSIEVWKWLYSRLPFFKVQHAKERALSLQQSRSSLMFVSMRMCQKIYHNLNYRHMYDQTIVEMQEFALYIASIVTELSRERNKLKNDKHVREYQVQTPIVHQSRITQNFSRKDILKKETNAFFIESEPSYALRGKILSQNK